MVIEKLRTSSDYVNLIIRAIRYKSSQPDVTSKRNESVQMEVDMPSDIADLTDAVDHRVLTFRLLSCGTRCVVAMQFSNVVERHPEKYFSAAYGNAH